MTPATDSGPSFVEPDPLIDFERASRAYRYLNSAGIGIVNYSTRC